MSNYVYVVQERLQGERHFRYVADYPSLAQAKKEAVALAERRYYDLDNVRVMENSKEHYRWSRKATQTKYAGAKAERRVIGLDEGRAVLADIADTLLSEDRFTLPTVGDAEYHVIISVQVVAKVTPRGE